MPLLFCTMVREAEALLFHAGARLATVRYAPNCRGDNLARYRDARLLAVLLMDKRRELPAHVKRIVSREFLRLNERIKPDTTAPMIKAYLHAAEYRIKRAIEKGEQNDDASGN